MSFKRKKKADFALTEAVALKAKAGDMEAKEQIVPLVFPLGWRLVKKYRRIIDDDEIVALLHKGIMRALIKWDGVRPLTTYVGAAMRGEVQEWCRTALLWGSRSTPGNVTLACELGDFVCTVSDKSDDSSIDFFTEGIYNSVSFDESAMEHARASGLLSTAIADLPERERTVINLYHFNDLKMREIAVILGVSDSRVCQLYKAGLGRLQKSLRGAELL